MREVIQEPAETDAAKHPANHFAYEAVTLRHGRVSIGTHLAGLGRLRRPQPLIETLESLIWRFFTVWHTSGGLTAATSPPRRGL